jgi:hypothetical protein
MAVDLFGQSVGNSPKVQPVSSGSTVAFREVGRHRACRPNSLIGNGFERRRNSHRKRGGDARSFEGLFAGNEKLVFVNALDMVPSGSFIRSPKPVVQAMSRCYAPARPACP